MRKIVSFLILTFCMLALLSVVASADTMTVELLAGQSIVAGTVTVSYDGGELCVTYDTEDGWELVGTHLAIATSSGDIPQTKKGNPKVGHFPYGDDDLGIYVTIDGNLVLVGGVDIYEEECIELVLGEGESLYIAAQAEVIKAVLDEDDQPTYDDEGNQIFLTETAWGDGIEFADDRNWAMYFVFPEPEPEP